MAGQPLPVEIGDQFNPEVVPNISYHPELIGEAQDNYDPIEVRPPTAISHTMSGLAIQANVYIPEEIVDPKPLVVLPGYFGCLKDYSDYCAAVAEHGKVAATLELPRVRSMLRTVLDVKDIADPQKLPTQSAHGLLQALESQEDEIGVSFDSVDIEGHSRGGPTSLLYAQRFPERVNSVTLDSPAGLEDHDIFLLASRLPAFFRNDVFEGIKNGEMSHLFDRKGVLRTASHLLLNPLRTASEAFDISKRDTRVPLKNVKNHEIPVGLSVLGHDDLIDADNTISRSGHLVDFINYLHDPRLRHLAKQRHPRAMAYLYIREILPKLGSVEFDRDGSQDHNEFALAA